MTEDCKFRGEPARSTPDLAKAHHDRAVQLDKEAEALAENGHHAEIDELRAAAIEHRKAADAGAAGDRGQLFVHASQAGILEDSAAWCQRRRLGLAG